MKTLEKKSEPMLDEPMMSNYPMFHVNGEQMHEIDEWEVDKEYIIKVKVKMKSYDSHTDMMHTTSHACFDMLAYEVEK